MVLVVLSYNFLVSCRKARLLARPSSFTREPPMNRANPAGSVLDPPRTVRVQACGAVRGFAAAAGSDGLLVLASVTAVGGRSPVGCSNQSGVACAVVAPPCSLADLAPVRLLGRLAVKELGRSGRATCRPGCRAGHRSGCRSRPRLGHRLAKTSNPQTVIGRFSYPGLTTGTTRRRSAGPPCPACGVRKLTDMSKRMSC